MKVLEEWSAVLDGAGPGPALAGLALGRAAAAELVAQRWPGKPFCIVRAWSILRVPGLPAPLLYADHVIFDSAGRFDEGDFVRSSPAIAAPTAGIFETRATVYVLIGDGCINEISAAAVAALTQ